MLSDLEIDPKNIVNLSWRLPPSWLRPLRQSSAGNAQGHQETTDGQAYVQTVGWGAVFIKQPPCVVRPLVNNTREVVRLGDEAFISPPAVSKPAGSPRSLSPRLSL